MRTTCSSFRKSKSSERREREQANLVATGGLRDQQEPTNASRLLFDVVPSSGRWVVRVESINWPGPRCVSMTGRPHSAQVVGPFKLALAPLCFASRKAKFRVQSFGSTLFFLTLCSPTLLTFLLFCFLLLTDANRSKSDVHFMRLVADAASPSAKINSHQPADLQGAEENLLAASSEDLTASSSSSSSSLSSSSLSSMARFLTTNGTVVIAQRGSTASLPCEVISLGDGVVSAILQLAPAANL